MKRFYIKLIFLSICIMAAVPSNGQVFWQDNFESTSPEMGGGTRASSVGSSTDGQCCGTDRFLRSTLYSSGSCCGCGASYSNINGSTAWGGEDLDGTAPCLSSTQTITWTSINITGRTGLTFKGLFGIRDVTSYETSDELRVQWQIDGGAVSTGIVFEQEPGLDLSHDTDFNGIGDGTILSNALAEFSFSIPSTGSTLTLIFSATIDGGGEEFVIDNFRIEESALPVELTHFDAVLEKEKVVLSWATATEENNEGFYIERSVDSKNWESIGFVSGSGTSYQARNYDFMDEKPLMGSNFYRLRQEDFDGAIEYHKIVSITLNHGLMVSVSPNPFNGQLQLQFPDTFNKSASINIYDLNGKLIYDNKEQISPSVSIDLDSLTSGSYFIRIIIGQDVYYQKIVKN